MTMNMLKKMSTFLFVVSLSASAMANTCSALQTLVNQDLHFFQYDLGNYTIYLSPTLTAIVNHQTNPSEPYFEKPWLGACPVNLGTADTCTEFTVYPNSTNFSPDPMEKIKADNHGNPDRGEVRILTNQSMTQYVYTTDHEATFCGPYPLTTSQQ